jgi:hypothetical protein
MSDLVVTEEIREAVSWPDSAQMIVVDDEDSYAAAVQAIKDVKVLFKKIDKKLGDIKRKSYVAYTASLNLYNEYANPCLEAETILKLACKQYDQIEDAKAKKAEAEYQKKLEASSRARGDSPKSKPADLPPPVVEPPPIPRIKEKITGVSLTTKWVPEIVDYSVFLKHLSGFSLGKAHTEAIDKAFMPWLRKHASANQDNMPIPGVEFKEDKIMAVR